MTRERRKFLYEDEIHRLLEACQDHPYRVRNQAQILLTYNHALRNGEMCYMKWHQINFDKNTILVKRQKGGVDWCNPLYKSEKEYLLELREINKKNNIESPYIFITSWKKVITPQWFAKFLKKLGVKANIDADVHPHMLRHSKGVFLVDQRKELYEIKAALGHKRISSTELYLNLTDKVFNDINAGSLFL
jgi:type 1 fimbriae regulatory protein FimB